MEKALYKCTTFFFYFEMASLDLSRDIILSARDFTHFKAYPYLKVTLAACHLHNISVMCTLLYWQNKRMNEKLTGDTSFKPMFQ